MINFVVIRQFIGEMLKFMGDFLWYNFAALILLLSSD